MPGVAMAASAKRVLYVYLPNGAQWKPSVIGSGFSLDHPLSDLQSVRDYVTVISGLQLGPAKSTINGDHSRGLTAFLSGQTPQFPGPNVGTTIDITLAKTLSSGSRVSNLCLAGEEQAASESGYTADYQACLSWLGGASPNPRDVDPGVVFDRIFGSGTELDREGQRAIREAMGRSILDVVVTEAQSLNKVLGAGDRARLQEYLQSVRELESRLSKAPAKTCDAGSRPSAAGYEQRIQQFYDLIFHAFQCGVTQVATFLLASESTNQSYDFIGLPSSHHDISHDSSAEGYAKIARIVAWQVKQFSLFCQRMQSAGEAGGNLLDNSILLLGGGVADGARHTHDNIPVLLVGRGGGAIRGGQHLNFEGMPFCNLHLTMANALGVSMSKFGDSSGSLSLS